MESLKIAKPSQSSMRKPHNTFQNEEGIPDNKTLAELNRQTRTSKHTNQSPRKQVKFYFELNTLQIQRIHNRSSTAYMNANTRNAAVTTASVNRFGLKHRPKFGVEAFHSMDSGRKTKPTIPCKSQFYHRME